MKLLISTALPALLMMLQTPTRATEPLDAETLERYCERSSVEPSATCVAYVNGFLDGAIATDARVAENVANEIGREESFTERALRTRVMQRLEMMGPTGYADFCVGDPVPLAEVIERVRDELGLRESLAGIDANSIVYAALKRHYPCTPATPRKGR